MSQLYFLDRDGTIDILFTTCDSVSQSTGIGTNCMINIAYNRQLPLCASATAPSVRNGKRICRPPTDLCTPDPDFRFNLHDGDGNEVYRCRMFPTTTNVTHRSIGFRQDPNHIHISAAEGITTATVSPRPRHDT